MSARRGEPFCKCLAALEKLPQTAADMRERTALAAELRARVEGKA